MGTDVWIIFVTFIPEVSSVMPEEEQICKGWGRFSLIGIVISISLKWATVLFNAAYCLYWII